MSDEAIDISHIPIGAVVKVTWGDPPDDVTAIVQQWTDDGAVVAYANELAQAEGHVWLAAGAIEAIEVLPDDSPTVRHLRAVGIERDAAQVEHESLASLLAALRDAGVLVLFQDERSGSDEASVGRVLRVDDETVTFSDIDVDGRDTGADVVRDHDELDRLEWDDVYCRALTVLNELDPGVVRPTRR